MLRLSTGPFFVPRCARRIGSPAELPRQEVTLRYGERAADLNVNRRRHAWIFEYPALVRHRCIRAGWRIAHSPNRRGFVDRRVKALSLENSTGEPSSGLLRLERLPEMGQILFGTLTPS
jgi:hypothetical protein